MVGWKLAAIVGILGCTLVGCGGGAGSSHALSTVPTAPVAGFTFLPASPSAGEAVQFTDTSTGSPTSWIWNFGDGSTSSTQNPTHAYPSAGSYTVTLSVGNNGGTHSTSKSISLSAAAKGNFSGSIVLGSPTTNSIKLNIFSADQSGNITVQYGASTSLFDHQSAVATVMAGAPLQISLDGLNANTQYYYRLYYQPAGGSGAGPTDSYTFRTARPVGSTFTFTIQADSHLDENSDLNVYLRTLANVAADSPDFHVDLGDTFMCEKASQPLVAGTPQAPDQATVNTRYKYERANFGVMSASVPLFLVNGNHEGEAGWILDGTANNLAIWTTQVRQQLYLNPTPDSFFSGDTFTESYVGQRASWYSWQWGDALFIVLDPYWNTTTKSTDGWSLSLGQRQYNWLRDTLAASTAKYKFVFIHSLVGGLDGQYRGGIEGAPYFEWGGKNLDGTDGFATKRPGWGVPIHQMLKQYGVTTVFHGHDHLYARQVLDGIIYQEVPQPSAKNTSSGPSLATAYHYASGTILSSAGHLRVTVSPTNVKVEYVRAWLAANETATQRNREVDDTWTATPSGSAPIASFSMSPSTPTAGQSIQFSDASLGSASTWLWNFGDGNTSSAQNPAHTYSNSGVYTVTLSATNSFGSNSVAQTVSVGSSGITSVFDGNIVLGSPTSNSAKANLFSPDQSGTAYIAYGNASGAYDKVTRILTIQPATPVEFSLTGLTENTQVFFRVYFQPAGASGFGSGAESSFHTARPAGSTFTFDIQGDSHPEREKTEFNSDLYKRTLSTAAADRPDFYLTIGDGFSVDTLDAATITTAQVTGRYTLQRPYLGITGASAPVFFVNGNQEQAARYLLGNFPVDAGDQTVFERHSDFRCNLGVADHGNIAGLVVTLDGTRRTHQVLGGVAGLCQKSACRRG